jgi:hypothetical protein
MTPQATPSNCSNPYAHEDSALSDILTPADELRITYLLYSGVKIALAAPFSWSRGGPPRAMDHLGE